MSHSSRLVPLLAVAALVLLASCEKKPAATVAASSAPKSAAIEVVRESERSSHFLAVSQQLELGGTLYGYVDVDGDALKLLSGLQELLAQIGQTQPMLAPYAKQDLGALATLLGLNDVKAIGASSVPDGTGFFRNRMFFYTGGERHGLVASLGGKPGPFPHLALAPADTSFYAESEIDLPVAYRAIKDVIAKVGGEPASTQFETTLKKAGEGAALSVLDLIYGLKGHSSIVVRLDPTKPFPIPTKVPVTLPGISLLISIDGIAPILEPTLAKVPLIRRSERGTLRVYELAQKSPLAAVQPVIVVDGNTLHLATTMEFFNECNDHRAGLAQDAAFQRALAVVGPEGNGLTYVGPKLFEGLAAFGQLNPNLPPESKAVVDLIVKKMPHVNRPMIAVRTNTADGILLRSYWDRSLKTEIAAVSIYNPVTIGALAAMAIPAFQKVRVASQDKVVLNNLRQFAAAGDQFCLENNVQVATYRDLVGPQKYIKVLHSVAGEHYEGLRFVPGQTLRVRLADGRTVQYQP